MYTEYLIKQKLKKEGTTTSNYTNHVTDCKSLLTIDAKLRGNQPVQHLQRSLMTCRKTGTVELRWHKTYPEKSDDVWSGDDCGSYKAAEEQAGLTHNCRALSHGGNLDPDGVIRDFIFNDRLRSPGLITEAAPARSVKAMVTEETNRAYPARRDTAQRPFSLERRSGWQRTQVGQREYRR